MEYMYPLILGLPDISSEAAVGTIISRYILRLEFPQLPQQFDNPLFLQPGQVLDVTLHALWYSVTMHYKFNTPITLSTSLPRIIKSLTRLQKEDDL
jgi:hypothetical protein